MRFYRLLLWKAYFDKGLNITNYIKYFIGLFALFSFWRDIPMEIALIAATLYVAVCPIIGWAWYKYELVETENEIQNRFNPFQREVREKFIYKKS